MIQFLTRDSDAEVFEDILIVVLTSDETHFIFQWLESLSTVDRFSVLKSFLSREFIKKMEEKLVNSELQTDEKFVGLSKAYLS